MNKQNKIDYLNQKCEAFPDCKGCPVLDSATYRDVCKTVPFDKMNDKQLDRLMLFFKARDRVMTVVESKLNNSSTSIGRACVICDAFIPVRDWNDDRKICHACIKKLRILMGIEQDGAAEDYTKLRRGDKIYYVDRELGQVEEGIIESIHFKYGAVDDFSVDFVESKDFDQFYGSSLGKNFFMIKSNAEKSLTRGGDLQDG